MVGSPRGRSPRSATKTQHAEDLFDQLRRVAPEDAERVARGIGQAAARQVSTKWRVSLDDLPGQTVVPGQFARKGFFRNTDLPPVFSLGSLSFLP